jgi:3-methyladenine DNA glycosylase AlkD
MTYKEVMQKLESLASHDPKDLAGMARFGINVDKAWVISIPKLRILAREIRKICNSKFEVQNQFENSNIKKPTSLRGTKQSLTVESDCRVVPPRNDDGEMELHELALAVWDSGIHEAKILASFIDVPELVTEEQMEKWVLDFDSWDVTDMVCGNLFDRTQFAVLKAREWSARPEEFVKRAGFVLMAGLAVHDKAMPDEQFVEFLGIIQRESGDGRNFVKKAVNWALRAIGKSRNKYLYERAMETANVILNRGEESRTQILDPSCAQDDGDAGSLRLEAAKAMRFIVGDALRELEKDYIKRRFDIE